MQIMSGKEKQLGKEILKFLSQTLTESPAS